MVTAKDLLTAVNRVLVEEYPDRTVYVTDCPKDFKRPSFLLETVRVSRNDAAYGTVAKTVYQTITCFIPIDKQYRSNPNELMELQDAVMQLFSCGFVQVGDRAIKLQSLSGETDNEAAYVDLQFQYYDDRSAEADTAPTMSNITIKLQEG